MIGIWIFCSTKSTKILKKFPLFLHQYAFEILIGSAIFLLFAILIRTLRRNRRVISWEKENSEKYVFAEWTGNLEDEFREKSFLELGEYQGVILVKNGKILDILSHSGKFSFTSKNITFFLNIRNLYHENELSDVKMYFFSKQPILKKTWGTIRPIIYSDSQKNGNISFGMFGQYSFSLENAEIFYTRFLSENSEFSFENFSRLTLSYVLESLEHSVPALGFSAEEIEENRETITNIVLKSLEKNLERIGIALIDMGIDGMFGTHEVLNTFEKSSHFLVKNSSNSESIEVKKSENSNKEIITNSSYETITLSENFVQNTEKRLQVLAQLKKSHLISEKEYETKKSRILESI